MKFSTKSFKLFTTYSLALLLNSPSKADDEESNMVKMCLFYGSPSGHARSDPILNQECASDHVHTFYGPSDFHPNTSYEQLINTQPQFSSSPFEENQSLYWHPSIYEVTGTGSSKTYTRVSNLETSPYYRWDTSTTPETVAFPPNFRMIAYSNADGASDVGEDIGEGGSLFVECCNMVDGEEDCTNTYGNPLIFPNKKCDFVGIAFAMPTCWDESKGVGMDDPFSHVAYTTDSTVSGPCPAGYDKRIPQVQLFVRIGDYRGDIKSYQLSDGSDIFHVDFMNGWHEGKLQEVIDGCEPSGEPGYNPPCDCDQFLTPNDNAVGAVCDEEVKQYVLDEETEVVSTLPRGTCEDVAMVDKSWTQDPPYSCFKEAIVFESSGSGSGSGSSSASASGSESGDEGDDEGSCDYDFEDEEGESGDEEDEEEDDRRLRKKARALRKAFHAVSSFYFIK